VDVDDDPLRPSPTRSWVEDARSVVLSIGAGRVVGAAVGVCVALYAGWWLLRPPPAPIEDSLPLTSGVVSPGLSPGLSPGGSPDDSADGSPGQRGSTEPGSPTVSVAPTEVSGDVMVHVAGQVRSPGVYRLSAGDRVIDALERAGGARRRADLDAVNLAAPVVDGVQVFIPTRGSGGGGAGQAPGSPTGSGLASGGLVDLNRADTAELDVLPGIGPSTAAAIVRHRDANGPFATVDDLLDVQGIGPAKLEAVRDLVSV
jgi:competence protein ComEA